MFPTWRAFAPYFVGALLTLWLSVCLIWAVWQRRFTIPFLFVVILGCALLGGLWRLLAR
jgi:hypothetical protein